ncbi:MAG TPA: hypothetical protein VKB64_02075 [Gaiellaceae bacterium]|nr:hypothetical protein [Gaiellaceae bacterium]
MGSQDPLPGRLVRRTTRGTGARLVARRGDSPDGDVMGDRQLVDGIGRAPLGRSRRGSRSRGCHDERLRRRSIGLCRLDGRHRGCHCGLRGRDSRRRRRCRDDLSRRGISGRRGRRHSRRPRGQKRQRVDVALLFLGRP